MLLNRKIDKILLTTSLCGISLLVIGATLVPTFSSSTSALEKSDSTKVNVNVDPTLSITVPRNLHLSISPTGQGAFKNASDQISVATNNVTGYTLTLSMADGADTSLHHFLDSEAIISNLESSSSEANFPKNKWGYTKEDPSSITSYSPLPALPNTHELKKTTEPAPADTIDFTVAAKVDTSIPSGTYSNSIKFTAVTNYVPTPTFEGITTMQEMTNEICQNETTPVKEATESTYTHSDDTSLVPTATLKDTRDNKTYTVSKLADGSCWMRDNLALELDKNTTYTKDNTDLNSEDAVRDGWKPDHTTYNGSTGTGDAWGSSSDLPRSIVNPPAVEGEQPAPANAGVYYNWSAAVASNDTSRYTTEGEKMLDSICPKGWQLPIADGTISIETNQFAKLWTTYGWDSSSYMMPTPTTLTSDPLNFVLAGNVWGGSLDGVGDSARLWSPIVLGGDYAYSGYFDFYGYARPDSSKYRYCGYSVRCVAR